MTQAMAQATSSKEDRLALVSVLELSRPYGLHITRDQWKATAQDLPCLGDPHYGKAGYLPKTYSQRSATYPRSADRSDACQARTQNCDVVTQDSHQLKSQ